VTPEGLQPTGRLRPTRGQVSRDIAKLNLSRVVFYFVIVSDTG
jgi:hypothetical protein